MSQQNPFTSPKLCTSSRYLFFVLPWFFFPLPSTIISIFSFSLLLLPCCYPTLDYYQLHLVTFDIFLYHIMVHNVNISEYCNIVNIFMSNGN